MGRPFYGQCQQCAVLTHSCIVRHWLIWALYGPSMRQVRMSAPQKGQAGAELSTELYRGGGFLKVAVRASYKNFSHALNRLEIASPFQAGTTN